MRETSPASEPISVGAMTLDVVTEGETTPVATRVLDTPQVLEVPVGVVTNAPKSKQEKPDMSPHRSGFRTRMLSAFALCAVTGSLGYIGQTAYRAATDSFVAPMILSPDSDIVVDSKTKLTGVEMDRIRTAGEAEGLDADLASVHQGVARLTELAGTAKTALEWTRNMNQHRSSAGSADLGSLGQQASVLSQMISKQADLTERARHNLDKGIITASDYAREELALHQAQLALLENARTRVQSALTMHEVRLAQGSLAGRTGAPPMPEVVAAEEQVIRVELDLEKLRAEEQAKLAARKAVTERLAQLDALETQLKSRPIFQAVQKNLEVAFVPYTQLDGVRTGGTVLECALGMFACKQVGTVTAVVPGEVVLSDPWGNPARGQYAVLDLRNHAAAKTKSLRIRSNGDAAMPTPVTVTTSSVTAAADSVVPAPTPTTGAEPVGFTETPSVPPTEMTPSTPPSTSNTGELIVSSARGHRVFVDGRQEGEAPGVFHVTCGSHSVNVGSTQSPHPVDVPCGGSITL